MCAGESTPDFKGQIARDRFLLCGNPDCNRRLAKSEGRVSQQIIACPRCHKSSRFDEPIVAPPVGYTPEQEIALELAKTDSVLAQAMADMVATFRDFIGQRHQRLVAA